MDEIKQIEISNEYLIDHDPETEPPIDHTEQRKTAKKVFSRIGLVIVLVYIGITVLTGVISVVLTGTGIVDKETAASYNYQILVGTLPVCFIGYPLMYLLLRKIPVLRPEKGEYKLRHEIMFIIISLSVTYIANIISTILMSVISGGQSNNQVVTVILSQQMIPTIYFVLIAPIGEELIFRKIIIDRVGVYGQKWAILFSAVLFALFHMNFYQLLYAFLLGLVLGYIYSKSGNIIYTMIIHIIINTVGSVIAPLMVSLLDQEKIAEMTELTSAGKEVPKDLLMQILPGLLAYYAYLAVYIALVIAGIVLLIINIKKFRTNSSEILPDAKTAAPVMFVNAGVILYFAVTFIFIVITFVSSFIHTGQ